MTDKERLLDAYNDYIEYEFQERRNVILDIKLGLMYSTDDDGNDLEMYYDTLDKKFYGLKNEDIVYEEGADYNNATDIIKHYRFDDYYSIVLDASEGN